MIYSDMGSQYTSQLFEATLDLYGLRNSYSLKIHPCDNALIENFYSMLKREWVFHQKFSSLAHVKLSISKYIEWCNHERISYREIAQIQFS